MIALPVPSFPSPVALLNSGSADESPKDARRHIRDGVG